MNGSSGKRWVSTTRRRRRVFHAVLASAYRVLHCRGATVTRHLREHVRSQGGVNGCSFYRAPQGGDLRRLQGVPGAYEARFVLPLFYLQPLYPATLSLLEVAAGQRWGLRIYELVVMPLSWHAVRSLGLNAVVPGALYVDRYQLGGGRAASGRRSAPGSGNARQARGSRPLPS
jgi:hypothetical protein